MLYSSTPLHFTLIASAFCCFSACQIQKGGIATVEGRKPDRTIDSLPNRVDAEMISSEPDGALGSQDAGTTSSADSAVISFDADSPDRVYPSKVDAEIPDRSPPLTISDALSEKTDAAIPPIANFDSLPALPSDVAAFLDAENAAPRDAGVAETPGVSPSADAFIFLPVDAPSPPAPPPPPPVLPPPPPPPLPIYDWRVDNLTTLGGMLIQLADAPVTTDTPMGPVVCFDGKNDGMILPSNPLTGLTQFTLQILIRPDLINIREPRFLHIEEPGNERHRLIMEVRSNEVGAWYPRGFMRWDDFNVAVERPTTLFPPGTWAWMAIAYDGTKVRLFLNGVELAASDATFGPLGEAPLALGMRLNYKGFFPGCLAQIIVSSAVLTSGQLRVP